ncbi:hypothetical protein ABZY20_18150 [Streptomyces sp. NPDC006624]|uniref:hypothetical protein n=1 Tax=Streptomyces sp. NPDC006624 TaxID=3154892 RepID=UPI0033AF48C3
MVNSYRTTALCVGASLALLVGCGGKGTDTASPERAAQRATPAVEGQGAASATELEAALLTPQDVAKAVDGLDDLKVDVKESADDPDSPGGWPFLKFIEGDAMCEKMLGPHPEPTDAWAWVLMDRDKPGVVAEEIDSFGNEAPAQDLMSENRDQSKGCRKFVAEGDGGTRYNFTYEPIDLPTTLGDESSGYKLDGTAVDDPSVTFDFHQVEIRQGSDVIFLSTGGEDTDEEKTIDLGEAALKKFSATSA